MWAVELEIRRQVLREQHPLAATKGFALGRPTSLPSGAGHSFLPRFANRRRLRLAQRERRYAPLSGEKVENGFFELCLIYTAWDSRPGSQALGPVRPDGHPIHPNDPSGRLDLLARSGATRPGNGSHRGFGLMWTDQSPKLVRFYDFIGVALVRLAREI